MQVECTTCCAQSERPTRSWRRSTRDPARSMLAPHARPCQHLQHVRQLLLGQLHQRGNLLAAAPVVVDREGIHADAAHAKLQAPLECVDEAPVAKAVAIHLAEAARLGKAAVPVHDEGNVARDGAAASDERSSGGAPRPAAQALPQPIRHQASF